MRKIITNIIIGIACLMIVVTVVMVAFKQSEKNHIDAFYRPFRPVMRKTFYPIHPTGKFIFVKNHSTEPELIIVQRNDGFFFAVRNPGLAKIVPGKEVKVTIIQYFTGMGWETSYLELKQ
ncbi:MAG: hypothetical protein Q8N21_00570 [bacterium]|nr:hypothetical protein [bacterium]